MFVVDGECSSQEMWLWMVRTSQPRSRFTTVGMYTYVARTGMNMCQGKLTLWYVQARGQSHAPFFQYQWISANQSILCGQGSSSFHVTGQELITICMTQFRIRMTNTRAQRLRTVIHVLERWSSSAFLHYLPHTMGELYRHASLPA